MPPDFPTRGSASIRPPAVIARTTTAASPPRASNTSCAIATPSSQGTVGDDPTGADRSAASDSPIPSASALRRYQPRGIAARRSIAVSSASTVAGCSWSVNSVAPIGPSCPRRRSSASRSPITASRQAAATSATPARASVAAASARRRTSRSGWWSSARERLEAVRLDAVTRIERHRDRCHGVVVESPPGTVRSVAAGGEGGLGEPVQRVPALRPPAPEVMPVGRQRRARDGRVVRARRRPARGSAWPTGSAPAAGSRRSGDRAPRRRRDRPRAGARRSPTRRGARRRPAPRGRARPARRARRRAPCPPGGARRRPRRGRPARAARRPCLRRRATGPIARRRPNPKPRRASSAIRRVAAPQRARQSRNRGRRSGLTAPGGDAMPGAARRIVDHTGVADQVAYARYDAPIGPLTLAATEDGLAAIAFGDGGALLDELARVVAPQVRERPERLDPVRRELDEYFAGRRGGVHRAARLVPHDRLPADARSRRSRGSRTARSRRTPTSRPPPGSPARRGPRAAPAGRTRSRWWCRATASCAATGRSAATRATWRAGSTSSATCWRSRASS